MRIVVRGLAVLVGVLGVVALLAGAGVAAYVGPDDTVPLRPREITSVGPVITTAPGALAFFGPTLVISAEPVSPSADLWLGVAHRSDLDSYLGDRARQEVTEVVWPGQVLSRPKDGVRRDLVAPATRDWWVARDSGPSPRLSWPMPDGDYGVALVRTDGKPQLTARLSIGIVLDGLFRTALLVLGTGTLGLAVMTTVFRLTRRRPSAPPAVAPDPAGVDPAGVDRAEVRR